MEKINLREFFFSVEGRMNRKKYILSSLTLTVVFMVIAILLRFAGVKIDSLLGGRVFGHIAELGVYILTVLLTVICVIWSVKRYHDLNKSGWWCLIVIIPIIGWIWFWIETWFIKGTDGDNNFGPDPLEIINAFKKN